MNIPTIDWMLAEVGCTARFAEELELQVCTDSRKLQVGDCFFALSGERDGHEYVASALRNGAIASVVSSSFQIGDPSLESKLIRVADPMQTLTDIARAWRQKISARVVGLTGSVGKTTTKDFLRAALGNQANVYATAGNYNNEIGVPITVLRTLLSAEVLICELGAARIGDISHLCGIANPTWGIVTAIAPSHIETFGSLENVQAGKRELFEHVSQDGIAFVPLNDVRCVTASSECKVRIGYGFDPKTKDWESAYVRGEGLVFDEEACAQFVVHGTAIQLSVPGRPAAQAALAAMTIALQHGIPAQNAAQNISRAIPTGGRASIRKIGRLTIIDDSYNASPASMRSALETLSLRQHSRKIAILGDMLELGDYSDSAHREIVGELDRAGVALAVLIGPRFSHVAAASFVNAQLRIFPSVDQALPTLSQLVHPDDLVLVKASRGMALERAIQKLEESFS